MFPKPLRMKKPVDTLKSTTPASKSEMLLDEADEILYPLSQLLIRQGVGYPQIAARLKQVFMQAAQDDLERESAKSTDAAISVRSGVHRKDVRTWRDDALTTPTAVKVKKELSLIDQIYTKWLTDAAYKNAHGKPVTLALQGTTPSFDSLVLSVTKDLHRRTVLDELLRLGLVKETEDGHVAPLADSLVPQGDFAEMLRHMAANSRDHLAAGVANISAQQRGEKSPFIERSVFASGLSALSTEQLGELAKQLWQPAFQQMVDAANQRHLVDKKQIKKADAQRMRFGVYFYAEPQNNDQ